MPDDTGSGTQGAPAGRPTSGAGRGSPLRALRHRDFWPYFAGNLLSNCGTWFQNLAQALLVYRLTGSTLLVGVVNFAQFVGTFVLAPWAGSAADQFDRRRLLVTTQAVAIAVTALLATLAAADLVTAPIVIGLALALGATTAFATPAMQALVPQLVPTEDLGGAVALNSITFNLARAVGPVAATVVIDRAGLAAAFAVNSLSYLALIAGLVAVHPRPQAPRPAQRPRLRESLRLVRDDRRLGLLLAVVAAVSLTSDPVNTLTPGFVSEVLGRSDTLVGILIGVFGAGAVLAAVTVAGRGDLMARVPFTMLLLAAGITVFGLSPSLPVAVGALAVGGFGFLASTTASSTLLQLGVDDAQRGRVMALWSVAFLGIRPFGSLLDGAVASAVGLRPAAVMMALPSAGLAVAMLVRRSRSRSRSGAGARP